VHLTNGEKLDLAEANVQWYSSDEGILTIENGKIKANNAGTATIYATFHYLDEEITTERITITVVATPDSLDEQLNKLYEENKIANPLYKQLINRLRQVQHHHEKGNSAQANHHLDKFLEHLLRSNIDE